MSSLLLLFITLLASSRGQEELSVYPIIMPMVVPSKNEIYLCTSIDLSATNETFWVRGFEPRVSEARVHHMIVAASATRPPRTPFNVWNCGNEKHQDPNYPNHSVFPDSADGVDTTIYLWAYGGRRTMLPPDTAFKVGGDSQIRHLVLQVHYINVENVEYGAEKDKEGDSSGVYLYYTREPQKRLAGVLSMHVDTNVPRLARSFQDVACKIQENKVFNLSLFLLPFLIDHSICKLHSRQN